ncbi:MAG: FGGY-family carbohydrate kinase [Actinomycetota bacterium]|nr:FGGY-family carbohydrate kinase [Actinomycetota bacterium]
MSVLCVDIGGSSATISRSSGDRGSTVGEIRLPLDRPRPHRVEFSPAGWWRALAGSGLDAGAGCDAVVVTTLRQGFVLIDGERELGPGILNSDRRGAGYLDRLRAVDGLYELTGHWPAPELTLPKLLHTMEHDRNRWAAATRLLFVHDWLVWRMTGVECTEVSYACAGQLADVAGRDWATGLLAELGIGTARLAPLVEAGARVGALREAFLGAPAGTPVVAGCGDTQLAAMAAGGLEPGVITVVAGSSTPVQAASAQPVADPLRHPWVSTHARSGLWAVETNCGYPGTMQGWLADLTAGATPSGTPGAGGVVAVTGSPEWSERGWATKAPMAAVGLRPDIDPGDLAQAFAEAHAFTIRANVEDLERAMGAPAGAVVLTGGALRRDPGFAARLADVLGRPVRVAAGSTVAGAAYQLVTGTPPVRDDQVCRPERPGAYDEPYARYLEVWAQLREHLPEDDA